MTKINSEQSSLIKALGLLNVFVFLAIIYELFAIWRISDFTHSCQAKIESEIVHWKYITENPND